MQGNAIALGFYALVGLTAAVGMWPLLCRGIRTPLAFRIALSVVVVVSWPIWGIAGVLLYAEAHSDD